MRLFKQAMLVSALTLPLLANASQNEALQNLTDQYLSSHAISEGITAVSLGVSTGPGNFQSYYAGRISTDPEAPTPNDNNLMQIGSITKSFTSILILQLEAQGKLNINDSISQYLANLPAPWQNVTIKELLNMTSGIPDYDNNQTMVKEFVNNYNPGPHFTPEQEVNFAWQYQAQSCPSNNCPDDGIFSPGTNWYYSNTNYALAGMIVSKVTGQPMEYEVHNQLLAPNNLVNTFYLPYSYADLSQSPWYPEYQLFNIPNRVIHGYDMGDPSLFPVGADMTNLDMSYAGAEGDITSNLHDVTQWIQDIFGQNSTLRLTAQQYQELETPVCENSSNNCIPGQPVKIGSNITDGYALGLGVAYLPIAGTDLPALGTIWDYEGETFGHRFFWILIQQSPQNPKLRVPYLLITAELNSAPAGQQDNIQCLALQAAETVEGLPLSSFGCGNSAIFKSTRFNFIKP